MARRDVNNQRMAALFMLGCLFFNYPLISLFNVNGTVAGIPVLYAWLFLAWLLLIGLMALVIEGRAG